MKRETDGARKVVVTGATSFIGTVMVGRLLAAGCRVLAVVRPDSPNRNRLPADESGRLAVIPLDLEQADRMAEAVDGPCDAFLHLGWDGAGSENRRKRRVQQKNVEDSLKALQAAADLGCGRFLFSGSQAEYGVHREPMTEETPCLPVSEYGRAKVDFMNRALSLCRQWKREGRADLDYVHARIFSVYGPGDHPWSLVESCLRAFSAGEEIRLGECTQMWNFLYVEDLADALLALLFHDGPCSREGVAPVFNVAGGNDETRPLREYVEIMYRLCGRRGHYVYGERGPNAEGPANLIPEITRISEWTGWHPKTSFEEGIRSMIEARETKR